MAPDKGEQKPSVDLLNQSRKESILNCLLMEGGPYYRSENSMKRGFISREE